MQDYYYQTVISQLSGCIPDVFGVMKSNGEILACTDAGMIGQIRSLSPASSANMTLKQMRPADNPNRYVFIDSTGTQADAEASLICASLEAMEKILSNSDEQSEYLLSIMDGKADENDLYATLQRLKIENPMARYLCLFHSPTCRGSELYDIINSSLCDANHDFILVSNRQNIILIKEMKKVKDAQDILQDIRAKLNAVHEEHQMDLFCGISEIFLDMKDLRSAWQQAKNALDDCEMSQSEIACLYDPTSLIGLIRQLPSSVTQEYRDKVLNENVRKIMDEETLTTIRMFFQHNLSISETSRALYINRNTLNYRLNRIKEATGIDLRKFDEALKFRTALLMEEHFHHHETK